MEEQPITVHRIRSGAREYRVVRSAPGPGRLVLRDEHHWMTLYADRPGLARLLALWSLAARSPHTLLYLPLRGRPMPDGPLPGPVSEAGQPGLDLVLAHHSLGFRPSAWKEVRARLGPGRPQRTGTPDTEFTVRSGRAERFHHAEFRDHLHFATAAGTLFVTASAPAFRDAGAELRSLLADAPAVHHRHYRRHPDLPEVPVYQHVCVELSTAPTRHGDLHGPFLPGMLHVQYCPEWAY
ncbi:MULTISPECIES: hypothetical protein [Kitasatospora]|uniref:Uncharacterized protein n=1 Tax=Kitasatospora setae (strain ATCC 33774 / DSM 43861 / JCM 3304 / KCC A-0304 / NBRC 14216 / KM-6054) TaxID=452652 RepID=E4N5Z6_KITSK|nr:MULTISPECIES: hypothetical protein [Kitasatospora]BAJ26627.1 hypothetical protein KSE_07880 [Kitasatospora setae KM-6054]